jgi:hypothetical protein
MSAVNKAKRELIDRFLTGGSREHRQATLLQVVLDRTEDKGGLRSRFQRENRFQRAGRLAVQGSVKWKALWTGLTCKRSARSLKKKDVLGGKHGYAFTNLWPVGGRKD